MYQCHCMNVRNNCLFFSFCHSFLIRRKRSKHNGKCSRIIVILNFKKKATEPKNEHRFDIIAACCWHYSWWFYRRFNKIHIMFFFFRSVLCFHFLIVICYYDHVAFILYIDFHFFFSSNIPGFIGHLRGWQ